MKGIHCVFELLNKVQYVVTFYCSDLKAGNATTYTNVHVHVITKLYTISDGQKLYWRPIHRHHGTDEVYNVLFL